MPPGERTDPFRNYRFLVEVDGLLVAGFSRVTGLEAEVETEEYAQGGRNSYTPSFPTGVRHPNVVLERGLTTSQQLWRWVEDARNGEIRRKDGRMFLLDETGAPAWAWTFRQAYPVKWTGPELRADQGEVAVESLELSHRGLTKVSDLPPP